MDFGTQNGIFRHLGGLERPLRPHLLSRPLFVGLYDHLSIMIGPVDPPFENKVNGRYGTPSLMDPKVDDPGRPLAIIAVSLVENDMRKENRSIERSCGSVSFHARRFLMPRHRTKAPRHVPMINVISTRKGRPSSEEECPMLIETVCPAFTSSRLKMYWSPVSVT